MRKKISSSMTFFYKYIFLIIWAILFMPYFITDLVKDISLNNLVFGNVIVMLIISGFTICSIYFFFKIVKVEIDVAGKLIVSNYRKVVEIPIQDIKKISQSYFFIPVVVWITLTKPSEFGDKIVFIPKGQFGMEIFGHTIVEELKNLASSSEAKTER